MRCKPPASFFQVSDQWYHHLFCISKYNLVLSLLHVSRICRVSAATFVLPTLCLIQIQVSEVSNLPYFLLDLQGYECCSGHGSLWVTYGCNLPSICVGAGQPEFPLSTFHLSFHSIVQEHSAGLTSCWVACLFHFIGRLSRLVCSPQTWLSSVVCPCFTGLTSALPGRIFIYEVDDLYCPFWVWVSCILVRPSSAIYLIKQLC